ncbi:hypothetical protein C8T65DRAFT_599659 [Cerioporus squamosus]|nr:hypothetical protein C8T65DRAFT_599659 [Cerioporus squamosus]
MLPDMPLDILYEVFLHLHPYDLLHLARTTKTLRRMLMTRSASTIWRRARENVPGLPDCPKDMSEPAYANLMFDPHCHFCLKARVLKVMWACRVRCCKSCFKDHFVELGEVFKACHPQYDALRPAAMLPAEVVNDRLYFLKRDLTKLLEHLATLNGDEAALKAVEAERMQAVEEQEDTIDALEAWRIAERRRRREERTELIRRREDQIIERLRQCGFDDLEYMTPDVCTRFMDHPLVKQPKELTDRIWNNIKGRMLAWAEGARAELRLHRRCELYTTFLYLFREVLDEYYAQHHYPEVVPSVADFSWYTPTFREILDKERDEKERDEMFAALIMRDDFVETIEAFVKDWRRDMARRLYDMIPPEVRPPLSIRHKHQHDGRKHEVNEEGHAARQDDPSLTDEQISRALNASVTWFRCTVNGCLLDYPRVLAHECAKTGPPVNPDPKTDMDDLQNAYNIILKEFPWNFTGDKIVYDMDAHRAAEKVVRVTLTNTNAVPNLTDKFWLDNLDGRYVCSECSKDGCLCVMPWRVAVKHLSEEKHRGKDVQLTVLNVEDRIEVLDQEAEAAEFADEHYKVWGCIRNGCRTPAMTMWDLQDHSLVHHRVKVPLQGVDYDLHPDAVTAPDVPADAAMYPEELFTTPILR